MVYFSDFVPSLTYRLNLPLSLILSRLVSHILSPCYFLFFLHLCKWLSSFLACISCIFLFFFTFLSTNSQVTLLLFQSIPHNSHPQLMALPWVKVHNTKSWVRAMKRLFPALATLNLWFWNNLRNLSKEGPGPTHCS